MTRQRTRNAAPAAVHLVKPRLEKMASFVMPGRKTYGLFREQSNGHVVPQPGSLQLLIAPRAMLGQCAQPLHKGPDAEIW
jgi:hypothetical protein